MGRARVPLELSRGRPHGSRWTRYTAALRAGWWQAGRSCYYCADPFAAPQLIEAGHLISPAIRPDLAWTPGNLVPCHGGTYRHGNRRCPVPECDLNCNWIAHNSPGMMTDENGADLPFTPQFLAQARLLRANYRGKNGKTAPDREIPPETPAQRSAPGGAALSPGRPW